MRNVARMLVLRGEAERRADGERLLSEPGDSVLVRRGVLRSLLMRCPDGCGQTLVVNLDPRAGKAWRLRRRSRGCTIYPSVWLDDGCRSHFVVWDDRILWCEPEDAAGNVEPDLEPGLEDRVTGALEDRDLRHVEEIAADLDASEWDVGRSCRRLLEAGVLRCGDEPHSARFGLLPPPRPDAGG